MRKSPARPCRILEIDLMAKRAVKPCRNILDRDFVIQGPRNCDLRVPQVLILRRAVPAAGQLICKIMLQAYVYLNRCQRACE